MKIINEFKAFAIKGNVIDMAVGIVVGAAFGKIITSIVSDIIMPPIGLLVGGTNFTDLKIVLKDAVGNTPAVTLNYGNFIQVAFDFLIIAFSIFLVVKALNAAKLKGEKKATQTKEEILLTEIRDILKEKKN